MLVRYLALGAALMLGFQAAPAQSAADHIAAGDRADGRRPAPMRWIDSANTSSIASLSRLSFHFDARASHPAKTA